MYPVSREFLTAIRSSHAIAIKVEAYRDGTLVAGGDTLIVAEGSVRVEPRAKVRRTLDGLKLVSLDGQTATLRDILDEYGTELQVYRGVRYPSGRTELAPIGRFRIDSIDDALEEPGAVTITAQDLAARVVDDRFMTPRTATAGATIPAQITTLIQESIPGAVVTDESGATATVPAGVVWERERWDAIDSLATSIGCEVFADPEGNFRIVPVTFLDSPAVWTVNAGSNGVLLGGQRSSTRDGVYNVVVASSSPTDGSTPVYGTASDTNPSSSTRVGGPFGRVPRFYSSPLIRTTTQAFAAASSILTRAIGRRGSLTLTSLVNPALECGDRIDVVLPSGLVQAHIADGFTVPLTAEESMPIATRATTDLPEES